MELILEVDGDEYSGESRSVCYDGKATVRISNERAESGYEQEPGPLTWLNSARIVTEPGADAVYCMVSIGNPRGAFCFTVRRLSDGRIVIHTPYPGEPMPHMDTEVLQEGILLVKGNFADEEVEDGE